MLQKNKNIANAIRLKTKTVQEYKPSEMAQAIESISGGGSEFITEYYFTYEYFDNYPTEYEKKEV